jgi:predicted nucleotide-binding protein (sugar kinase/HSP70/actin superfamily)
VLNPFYQMHWQKARELGRPYVANRIGGETMENLGDIIQYKQEGWDGLVHIYPFTCMPEIITRAIAPQLSKENDMPFLSLVVDEHTGEAGFQTRIEAFIDLLRRRKQEKLSKTKNRKEKFTESEMGVYV